MTLTPQDIRDQQFTTVRMRTGYDMDEVDGFLDIVETEITRLLTDSDDLRARLAKCQSQVLSGGRAPESKPEEKKKDDTAAQPVVAATPPAPAEPAAPAVPPAQAAFAIIEMAQKTADDTIAAAKAEAGALLAEARATATTMTADLEGQRKVLEDQVAQLRTYERNYRSRLRDYIQGQLANLDNLKSDASVAPEGAPEGPPLQA